jgi:hypothetical protein
LAKEPHRHFANSGPNQRLGNLAPNLNFGFPRKMAPISNLAPNLPNAGSVLNLRNGGVVSLPNVLNFTGFLCSFHFPKVEKFHASTNSGIPYEEFLNIQE